MLKMLERLRTKLFFEFLSWPQQSTPREYSCTKNSGIDVENARESENTTRIIRKAENKQNLG